jgi:hypothetical protein
MAGNVISDIAKDNLIFYFDVPNSKFYPGGSACYSLLTGYPGTLENSVGITGGTYTKAFDFDGTDDYVNFPKDNYKNDLYPEPPVGFDFWIRVDSACPNLAGIFSSSWDSSAYYGFAIQLINNGSTYQIFTSYGDGIGNFSDNRRTFVSPSVYPIDTWVHVTISIEGTSSYKYFMNTVRQPSGSITGGHLGSVNNGTGLDSRLGKAWITAGQHFKGQISNFKFYHRSLTEADAKQNYDAHQKRYM